MDGNTRICKKCLLREMDEAGFFQNMYDYIARIPADDKTPGCYVYCAPFFWRPPTPHVLAALRPP